MIPTDLKSNKLVVCHALTNRWGPISLCSDAFDTHVYVLNKCTLGNALHLFPAIFSLGFHIITYTARLQYMLQRTDNNYDWPQPQEELFFKHGVRSLLLNMLLSLPVVVAEFIPEVMYTGWLTMHQTMIRYGLRLLFPLATRWFLNSTGKFVVWAHTRHAICGGGSHAATSCAEISAAGLGDLVTPPS